MCPSCSLGEVSRRLPPSGRRQAWIRYGFPAHTCVHGHLLRRSSRLIRKLLAHMTTKCFGVMLVAMFATFGAGFFMGQRRPSPTPIPAAGESAGARPSRVHPRGTVGLRVPRPPRRPSPGRATSCRAARAATLPPGRTSRPWPASPPASVAGQSPRGGVRLTSLTGYVGRHEDVDYTRVFPFTRAGEVASPWTEFGCH